MNEQTATMRAADPVAAEAHALPHDVSASAYSSADMAPVPPGRRTWRARDLAVLWISMAACVPTYMLASSLIDRGMSWWQAVLTIFLGNCVVLVPMALNAHAGTRYGIPFPVYCRSAFGLRGANVPALMRALVACGWFGIQAWIGGEALQTLFKTIMPSWPMLLGAGFGGHTTTEWLSFMLFWGL